MIQLIQFPWSPFCLVQRRLLEFSGAAHKVINIPPSDRSLVWRRTRRRYYQVPVVQDGRQVLFELEDDSQIIAKYLDAKLELDLFPKQWEGLQRILWRHIESEVEEIGFKANDAWYREFVPADEQLAYLRHKERRFGRGCLDQWRAQHRALAATMTRRLVPFEQMLATRPYLLDTQPRFVDFDLWGMLANFLFSGHYSLPAVHPKIKRWFRRISTITFADRSSP